MCDALPLRIWRQSGEAGLATNLTHNYCVFGGEVGLLTQEEKERQYAICIITTSNIVQIGPAVLRTPRCNIILKAIQHAQTAQPKNGPPGSQPGYFEGRRTRTHWV
jgi:hypothetical protein